MTRKNVLLTPGIILFALCLVCGPFTNIYAEQKQVPKALKQDLQKALANLEKDGQEHEFIEKMKKAGASYFPEVTLPAQKGQAIRDPETQRQMVGIYLMDMSYASVFGKNKESLQFAEAVNTLLTKLGFSNTKMVNQYKKAMKDFQGPNAKKAMIELDKVIDNALTEAIQSPPGMDLAIDASYGWWVEGLYLTTEIAAQKNYDPKFMAFVNEQKKTARDILNLLDIFKKYPDYAAMMEIDERIPIVRGIFDKLKSSEKISKADIESIRATVAKARAAIVK